MRIILHPRHLILTLDIWLGEAICITLRGIYVISSAQISSAASAWTLNMAKADTTGDFSSKESEWEDDFPEETVQMIDRIVQEQDSSSEESDFEEDEQIDSTTPGGRRWVPIGKGVNKIPQIPSFDDSDCGMTDGSGHTVRILDFFQVFFSHWFLQMILNATNTYALRERAKNPDKHKCKWDDISIPELIRFLALSMLMGIIRKSRIKDYWSTLESISTPYFTSVMKRDKFMAILR